MLPETTLLTSWIDAVRLLYVAGGLGGAWLLWRRPRPLAALALILGWNLAAWAAYTAPLGRLYGLGEDTDRAVNVATAATVAAGNSPWEGAQAGYSTHEPFWDVLLATLAGGRPERVVAVYQVMTPLSIAVAALGLYLGLRMRGDPEDEWECALVVLAVLGLSSFSLSQQNPLAPFWVGNFLVKPNHAAAIGIAGLALGQAVRRSSWWALGLTLGLLCWVFVMTWALVVAALVVGTWWLPRGERDWSPLLRSLGLSALLASPDLVNLARDFGPLAAGESPRLVWRELAAVAAFLARPHWVTTDLGPLLLLAAGGAWVLHRRRGRRDALLLGLLAAAWAWWTCSAVAALVGRAFEPDEVHYFVRLALALAAGAGLAEVARHVERWRNLASGRGPLLVLAAVWPLTFPAHWNPETDSRYLVSLPPIGEAEREYARWVAEHTPGEAIFVAGLKGSTWIGALSGRRVLLSGNTRPPADYSRRKEAERLLLTSPDPDLVRRVAEQTGVGYLAVDPDLIREYGEPLPRSGAAGPFQPVFSNAAVSIWALRSPPAAP